MRTSGYGSPSVCSGGREGRALRGVKSAIARVVCRCDGVLERKDGVMLELKGASGRAQREEEEREEEDR